MADIVLAHGILGYGTMPFGESLYFNGIAKLYRAHGHWVLVPTVDMLGSLDRRSAELQSAITNGFPASPELVVIAHSMGGLDMRRVVHRDPALAARVKAIVCICTPHFGSPVADAVLDPANPLRPHIPAWLLAALGPAAGALADLVVRATLQDPDVPGISYFEIAGIAPNDSPLFGLCQEIGKLSPSGNDGVVTVASATAPGRPLLAQWPVDHGGAIGWPSGQLGLQVIDALLQPPADHLRRYKDLLATVLAAV
jgi:triacylglycerol lipase